MAAVMADGPSRILNAASEPHVQGLCHALNVMGAGITGVGSNVLTIEAPRPLHGACRRLSPDHIEIGSFVAIAAMTGGEHRVPDVLPDHLRMIRIAFARLGVETLVDNETLLVPARHRPAISADVYWANTQISAA